MVQDYVAKNSKVMDNNKISLENLRSKVMNVMRPLSAKRLGVVAKKKKKKKKHVVVEPYLPKSRRQ